MLGPLHELTVGLAEVAGAVLGGPDQAIEGNGHALRYVELAIPVSCLLAEYLWALLAEPHLIFGVAIPAHS